MIITPSEGNVPIKVSCFDSKLQEWNLRDPWEVGSVNIVQRQALLLHGWW